MADTLQQLLRERADQHTVAIKYGDRSSACSFAPAREGMPAGRHAFRLLAVELA